MTIVLTVVVGVQIPGALPFVLSDVAVDCWCVGQAGQATT